MPAPCVWLWLRMNQVVLGRGSAECQRAIRNVLETMSAAEIAEADAQYRERYGQSLRDAIMNDSNMSPRTKEPCEIYLAGHDRRTREQSTFLAQRACENADATMFQEVMRRAPEDTRQYFRSLEGQQRMRDAFEGHWYNAFTLGLTGNITDTEYRHVTDYAENGRLSVATQITENCSLLRNNRRGIELALNHMSEQERERYRIGRQLARGEQVPATVTDQQKDEARRYYTETHSALQTAAGKWWSGDSQRNELAKWEDLILCPGGSLVGRLAVHRGDIYNSSMNDVISSVEEMSEADWKRLRDEPDYRGRIVAILDTYLSLEERNRAMEIIDRKRAANTFAESLQSRRPILEALDDNIRRFRTKTSNIYGTIECMTDAEQALYRRGSASDCTDPAARQFARDLDEKLRGALNAAELRVASGLLSKVKRGEKPEMEILDKLNLHGTYTLPDSADVIRDIQAAFRSDARLRERVNNPQTNEDRAYSRQFLTAARNAMGQSDFDRYAKPLIETGHIPMDVQMELNRGYFRNDRQGACQDIQNASDADRQRILNDAAYQERVLGFMSPAERQVALNSMRQGEMKPEDKIRSCMLGMGTSRDEVKQIFAGIKNRENYRGVPENEIESRIRARLDEIRRDYARKYGTDLTVDLMDEFSGRDRAELGRNIHERDARSEYLYARQQAERNRHGFGSAFVDAVWDGSGHQVDNEVHQLSRMIVEDPNKMHEYVGNLYNAIDAHSDSKAALADAVINRAMEAVAVGGMFVTGGVSLTLLAYTGAAAAVFKVGAKAAIMGSDYDPSKVGLLFDATTGFAEGFTSLWGAGVGRASATRVLDNGGRAMLRQGSERAFRDGAEALVRQGLRQGGRVSDEAMRALVRRVAIPGQEEAMFNLMRRSLAETIQEQSRLMLTNMVKEMPGNILKGMAKGAATGAAESAVNGGTRDEIIDHGREGMVDGATGAVTEPFKVAPTRVAGGTAWRRMYGRSVAAA